MENIQTSASLCTSTPEHALSCNPMHYTVIARLGVVGADYSCLLKLPDLVEH